MDRHDLYELCVQSARDLVPFLRAMHEQDPRVLCEDFCGTAALSRAWCEMVEGGSAIGTDLDEDVLARAARGGTPRLALRREDARSSEARGDLIFVGNFSIGEIHDRGDLVAYLTRCRERLGAGGVFICDTYGGDAAYRIGHVHRMHRAPDGRRVRYTWEQREANPLTGMVENALHFRVDRGGTIEEEVHEAFVYHWRLWSVPELRDAMCEAGFASADVYNKMPDAMDEEGNAYALPTTEVEDEEGFIVCVVGRM